MYKTLLSFLLVLSAVSVVAAQATLDAPFQVHYASNLAAGDSVVDITNAGKTGANLCVNVYTFSADEQMVSCCSCVVTPNALVSLSVDNDLISNTLTPAVPTSVVIKLLATSPTTGACNAATGGTANPVATGGLLAWGTTLHANSTAGGYDLTETPFSPATLSSTEHSHLVKTCGFIQANGSGYGICRSCRFGGLITGSR